MIPIASLRYNGLNMSKISSTSLPLHVRFGEFELDERNALLLRSHRAIPLSPIPFNLLCALVRDPGTLLTKDELLDRVWGHRFVSASVLKGAISDLRTLLGDSPRQPRFIETVSRRGYRFICPLLPQGESAPPEGPLPPAVRVPSIGTPSPEGFIGRGEELARLQDAWRRATQGQRTIVWVAGEPGIGKSTLIAHFCSGLDHALWVRGQCVQLHGSGEPYLPVLEAIAELCRRDEQAIPLLRSVAPTWLLQLPWLCSAAQREALLNELVGAHPQRMLREMSEFLDRYTEHRPLLLITEDLHWGDPSTLQLVDYLARRRSHSRLMWLGSFRLTEIIAQDHPLNELRHELRPQGLCEEILLDAFSERDVATYVCARLPTLAAEDRFVKALHERTSGVPLFVASLANEVLAQAAHGSLAGLADLARTRIPESLNALIDHHVAKLSGERRQLLTAAAVFGMTLRLDMLSRVLDSDPVQVAELCDRLARERLWLTEVTSSEHALGVMPSFVFHHQLFRQRLYDGLPGAVRAAWHGKIGALLQQDGSATAAELAMHFDRGREPMKALGYYAEAARAALLHLSPVECMGLTERALFLIDQMPESAQRHALEITLATLRGCAAFHTQGAGDDTRAAYQRATRRLVEVPSHPMAGLALHGFGLLLDFRAEYDEALAIAARAQALATERADPLLTLAACTIQGHALMMQGHHLAAREVLELALPALEQATATTEHNFIGFIADPQATVLALLSLSLAQLGLFHQARERLRQAYARSRRLAQPMALMFTLWCDALCAIRHGDVARVAALAGEMATLVDRFSLAQGKAACRWFQGWAESHCGSPLEGGRQICLAYEENRALGMLSGSSETLGYAAEALVLQQEWEGAQATLAQALAFVHSHGERIVLPQLLLLRAATEQARGDVTAAATSARHARAEAMAQAAPWLEVMALTALCDQGAATPEERAALAGWEERLAAQGEPAPLVRTVRPLANGKAAQ